MTTIRSFMEQTWTDLNSPTKEEIDSLVLIQHINPIIAKDLLTPTPLQYAEEDDSILYAVLHIPAFKHSHTFEEPQEIDFVISARGVITARYDSIDALHFFAKQMEVNEILNKGDNTHLFFGIMKKIYDSLFDELAYFEDWMQEIEKSIFSGKEKDMVFAISNISRNLLNFKRVIDPHGSVFEFLATRGGEKFGQKFGEEIKELHEYWRRISRRVGNQIDLVNEFRETNNSMLSTKQNETMKQLAVMGSILLPLTLVGQIFGLSIKSFPLLNHPYAFWIIIGLMATVMLISLIFAKIKKWM